MRFPGPLLPALFAVWLPAQEGPPTAPAQNREVLVDTVIATVNDAAIMLSTIRTQTAGTILAAERSIGRPLRTPEILTVFASALDREVERHSLAQSAKSFGIATPEQVEQLFSDEMKREEAEQVRDLGTWQEFSRELQRQGRTWQTYWREQRVEKMFQFAQDFAIRMRMQKQSNLFLTPKMLRETYRREKGRFVHGAEAEIAIAIFTGPQAAEHAATAAAKWAQEDISPRQLINGIDGATGTALPVVSHVTDSSREALASEMVDFALAGPLNQVSQPMPAGNGFHVVKITAY